jgi:pyroglutamyl-peptidase
VKRRVLISGFEAFGGEDLNPTQKLVEALAAGSVRVPKGVEARGVVLPVVFGDGFARLDSEIRAFKPDVVLALGQAGGRAAIEFERVAVNLMDSDQPDNSGKSLHDRPIDEGAAAALFSTLPIRELVDHLNANEVPARISNSAGLYVCNEVFFRLQARLARTMVRSGFVHVPYLPEQAVAKSAPSMSFETLNRGLELILEKFAQS